jgi:hypothetical protein
MDDRRCEHCGQAIPTPSEHELALARRFDMILPATGRRFCSPRCRKRAFRRRRAGLPENAYPQGANRGHVRLQELTSSEQRDHWLQIRANLEQARRSLTP